MARLFLKLFMVFLAVLFSTNSKPQSAHDERMIARATPHLSLLNETIDAFWPDLDRSMRTFFPAQIEQESLWVATAELCVPKPTCSRERGVGFGQFTITPKMNVFEEAKRSHPALRDWQWADRFSPRMQFIAIVVKDKGLYRVCRPLMSNDWGGFACVAASYNGGFGGFSSDRRLCGNTIGCNPLIWTGNIEVTSNKAKVKVAGYGKSFFEINREYVDYVMRQRRPKYNALMGAV